MVINLYGGPGSGKSTTAAGVFSKLKLLGVNVELVTEYAKDLTWEESFKKLGNQNIVSANQHHRQWILNDVDVIITDSPIIQGLIYSNKYHDHIMELFNEFDNINIFLNRKKAYQTKGRSQTLDQAITLDNKIKEIFLDESMQVHYIDGDESAIDNIVEQVKLIL